MPGGQGIDSISDNAIWLESDQEKRGFIRPRRLLLVADLLGIGVAFGLTYLTLHLRGGSNLDQTTISLLGAGIILVIAVVLLLRARQYSAPRRLELMSAIAVLIRDIVLAAAITMLLSYLTKGFFTGLTTPSRVALAVAAGSFLVLGSASRLVLGTLQRRQYASGKGVRRILLAGDGVAADELLQLVQARPEMGVMVVGRMRLDIPEWPTYEDPSTDTLHALTVSDDFEGLRELDRVLRSSRASEVVIALDPEDQAIVPRLGELLGLAHVPFRVVSSLFEETYHMAKLLGRGEIPVVELEANPLDRLGRIAKRTLDIGVALTLMIVLLPLELAVTLAILLSAGTPVLFAQDRVGKNGRRFRLYKFRTMVKDAEAKLKELQAQNELADSGGRMFKMRRDPRITRVGAVLRKCSLDELPQFFNVLKGDMSVVGPRPPLPSEVVNYERHHLSRLRVLPGITGLWQVSGRNELGFDDMVALDRYYVENWSIRLDLSIMLKTFWVLMSRKGAY